MGFYTFLPKLLNMSLTGSIAIVCVLLLRLLLKKAPKVISYALWAVVLFRLLCPVSITSGFSLFGLLDAPATSTVTGTSTMEYVPENIVYTEFPEVAILVLGVSETINNTLPQGQEQLVADSLEAPVAIGTYVWLLGVLAMAVYSVLSYVRLKRKLLIASPLQDNIWLADEITTPFVMGLILPKIYLPSDTQEHQTPYLILHEKHHIRRGDHIFKALAFFALSIHWFNPLVWVAFIYANKDMEMSCDEAVVKKMGEHILADYTASLLSLATGKTIIVGVPLAFGEGDTKGRIRNLAHWKKPAFWVVLVAIIACIALGVGLMTNPKKENVSVDNDEGYYLMIGAEGVAYIEVSGPASSSEVIRADGSAFRVGEKVWLEHLQGVTDLRGISIMAFKADGEVIYGLAVPENASGEKVSDIIGSNPWLLVPTAFEVAANEEMKEGQPMVAKWTFSPMMSATGHAAFSFHFSLHSNTYSHIEATCDNGKLWNLHAPGQPREKEMRFEQGEPLCWTPDTEGESLTDTAASARITFTVFAGEEIVSKGVLDIVRTGEEEGQSFYEAQLSGTDLFALWQEEGSNEVHVVMAGNGSIVSYSDFNHNRINERVVVREAEPDMIYELLVVEEGIVLWKGEAGLPHVGWTTFLDYQEDGESYLIEYKPQMYQGVGSYTCRMFSLENNVETLKKEWSVDFTLPGEERLAVTPEMEQFAREVGLLLRNCYVLLSTEQSILVREFTVATALPQLYPVRFDPEEIWAAIDGNDMFTADLKQLLGVGPETEDDYYAMVTAASAKEVEQFAAGVKEDVLLKDWESLSGKLAYPIQISGKAIQNAKEFLAMDIDDNLNQEFVNAIAAESCREMFFNYQGIMMGETGQIWIAGVKSGSGQWELKVIALNGLTDQISLVRVMDRVASGIGLENALPCELGHIGLREDTLIKLCVSESGKYEAYGIISPEYGNRGILLNYIIDGEPNWNYFDIVWNYGKKDASLRETGEYEVLFTYYREDHSECELYFDTYETGTMNVREITQDTQELLKKLQEREKPETP